MALTKTIPGALQAPDGSYYVVLTDGAGNLNPSAGMTYSHINTATTTVVKNSAGVLHTLVVNGGTAGSITLYDNTAASGTVIAILTTGAQLGSYIYDVSFSTGLTIVTAAATDITVSYR